MGYSKKKKKKKNEEKTKPQNSAYTYVRTANGHPIVIVPEYIGLPNPSVREQLVYPRKPRGRRRPARTSHHKLPFDTKNQVIYYIEPGSGKCVKKDGGHSDSDDNNKVDDGADVMGVKVKSTKDVNRKGRPRGSKNKTSMCTSFNNQCEKRSFTYSIISPTKCKSCNRPIDGDPVLHCLENHKTICPICGRTYKPPLTAHIKSHGVRQIELTVSCYECYDCKEKFGNTVTMTEHVLDEHFGNASVTKDMVCCLCDTPFVNIDDLRDHVIMVHMGVVDTRNFPDRCGYCDAQTGRSAIAEHMVEKHLNKTVIDLKCMLCGIKFDDQTAIVDHLVSVHCPQKTFSHPTVYRCRVCQAGFKSQINVLRHACNKIKTPHCERCAKTFPSKMRYAFHLQFHEHPKYAPMHLHCDLCLAEFDDEYQLYDHIRFRHELHDKAVCEICGRTFKSTMGLNIHRRYHNGQRNFTCKLCDKSFLNKSTLREHEISHMDVKPFQCHICGQYLSRASRLRSHVKTHKAAESTEQMCYTCESCGFAAPGPGSFAEHANKEHCGGGGQAKILQLSLVVKCEFCDATFMDAVCLNGHRDFAHSNIDNSEAFICVVCSSTFSTYSRLTTHKLTHGINMESALVSDEPSENVDPDRFNIPQFFSCQYCAKKCLHYTYYCLHRRLKHSLGEQAYTCDRCFLEFKTSWRLSYHKKSVHGQPVIDKKPSDKYKCTVCSRKFIKIGALNLHKTRTHIDIVGDICKYLCHQCGKFFSSECSLKNHAKLHDGIITSSKHHGNPVAIQQNRYRTYRKSTTNVKSTKTVKNVDRTDARNDKSLLSRVTDGYPRKSHLSLVDVEPKIIDEPHPFCTAKTVDEPQPFCTAITVNDRVLPSSTVCDLCDENVGDSETLRAHLENHAATNECLLCWSCYTTFLSTAEFDAHASVHVRPANATRLVQPDVQFFGVPLKNESDNVPLIVDCSKIFHEKSSEREELPIASNIIRSPESYVLDELLTIISTPRTSTIFDYDESMDNINDMNNIDNIDDLLNSIGN